MFSLAYRLVEPAKILVIIGIAYTFATTGWYVFAGPNPSPIGGPPITDKPRPSSGMSVAEVIAMNLMGAALNPGIKQPPPPETDKRLTLEGIFLAKVPEESSAIVSEPGRPGELTVVGGKLPGGAILNEVYVDRIVLSRNGVRSTLFFPDQPTLVTVQDRTEMAPPMDEPQNYDGEVQQQIESGDAQPEEPPPAADATPPDTSASIAGVVQSYRERLQQDPNGTLSALGMAPVSADSAKGYRLDSLAASPYLAQTGLQAGDVVLSVNGRPVGDIQQDHLEIDNIMAQGSARLEVQRGTRRFFVTTSLK